MPPAPLDLLPSRARHWLRHARQNHTETRRLRSLFRRYAATRHRPVDAGPVASRDVVARTALMHESELAYKSDRQVFLATGRRLMADVVEASCRAGLDLEKAEAAFELGCGGARLIRHLRELDGLRLVGSDLLEENVRWCRARVPGIEYHVNQLAPPLEFAQDGEFDLAFAYSVFTHIPYELQRQWIEELARIVRPGGIAAVTVLGPEMARVMLGPDGPEELERRGHVTLGPDDERVSASSARIGSWDVFVTPAEVRRLFSGPFEVVEQQAGAQSLVVLRRLA